MPHESQKNTANPQWDHSSHENFYNYYAQESNSEKTWQRFLNIQNGLIRILSTDRKIVFPLSVADIGCGAGTQCRLWAKLGHHVVGVDVNQPLLELARQRATDEGIAIDFKVASATNLPLADSSIDVCLVPELLEHVIDWQSCLSEFSRILKPGGILFLSTTNVLCPIQMEFNLPLYSWYPKFLKLRFEKLALTSRPELVNYAKYPAVHWFSYFSLRAHLKQYGFFCLDRFDAADYSQMGALALNMRALIRNVPLIRFLAHVATPYTSLIALKSQTE